MTLPIFAAGNITGLLGSECIILKQVSGDATHRRFTAKAIPIRA
jgi:hypothetical protein